MGTAEAGHEQEPGQLGLKAGHRLMQGPGLKEPQSGTSGAVMGRAPQEPLPFFWQLSLVFLWVPLPSPLPASEQQGHRL